MEKWPSFDDRSQWYKTKLLAMRNDPHAMMSYSTHRELCNDAFKKADCHYLKGTHCGRHEGCKLADMQDIPDAQIRRLGRWDHSRMIQHYSLGIPRTGARHLAGHGSMEGMFILPVILTNRQLLSQSRMSHSTRRAAKTDISQTRGNRSDE